MMGLRLVLLACLLPIASRAEVLENVRLSLHKADILAVLMLYERLTGKPVFIALDVQGLVTIESAKDLTHDAAVLLIHTSLLERYGLELSTTEKGETLAAWSKDQKYPRRTDEPETEAEQKARPKGHIRPIPAPDKCRARRGSAWATVVLE